MHTESSYRLAVLAIDQTALQGNDEHSFPPLGDSVLRLRGSAREDALLATVLLKGAFERAAEVRSAVRKTCERLLGGRMGNGTPCVGVGFAPTPADEAVAEQKALVALRMGKALWREPRIVLHRDVVVFDTLRGNPEVLRGLARLLDPLIAYDADYGTDLVRTLETFSEAELSQITAARRLGVHRHTVSARLRQVEHVLGHPVRSGPDRLLMELAPKARRLLASIAAGDWAPSRA